MEEIMKTLLRNKIEDALANLDEGRESKHMKLNQDEILEILKSDRCKKVHIQAKLRTNDGSTDLWQVYETDYTVVYPPIAKKDAIKMVEIDNLQDDKTYEVMLGFLNDEYRFCHEFKVCFISS